jgi:hypothetical protein
MVTAGGAEGRGSERLGFGRGKGNGTFERGRRGGKRVAAGQSRLREGLTGGAGGAGEADGWGQQGKTTQKQCSIFQIQKLLPPGLHKLSNIYWRKIKLSKT